VTSPPALPADLAQGFAATALANVQAAYPFHLVHFARNAADLHPPDALHPAFFGSYDWHSCVHMHWTLVRLWTLAPELAACPQIEAQLDARLTPDRIAGELHYFTARASFERPYGWGWLLALHAALVRSARTTPRAAAWRDAVAPLADLLATRCIEFCRAARTRYAPGPTATPPLPSC
jgi:hypothetical protein